MQKIKPKKLRVDLQIIRVLDNKQLAAVAGGASKPRTDGCIADSIVSATCSY